MKNIFKLNKMNKKDELVMLFFDNSKYTKTNLYLDSLISNALSHYPNLSQVKKTVIKKHLKKDVIVAAEKYLDQYIRSKKIKYHFSTYFTWYIARRINSNLK